MKVYREIHFHSPGNEADVILLVAGVNAVGFEGRWGLLAFYGPALTYMYKKERYDCV